MNARTIVRTLLVSATLALAAPAAAQWHGQGAGGPGAPGGGPGCHDGQRGPMDPAQFAQHWQMRAQRLAQRLSLNAQQQQQLGAIVQQEVARFQQSVASLPPRTPQRQAARQALMQDFDARFSAILTPAQRTQWDALKQEMQARRAEHRGHFGRGGFGQGGPGAGMSHDERFGI